MTLEQQALHHLQRGQYEQARTLYQQLSQIHPHQIEHQWYQGLCLLFSNQVLAAQWIWQTTIEATPNPDQTHLWDHLTAWLQQQAHTHQERGDLPQAEQILCQLLEIEENGTLYHALGTIRMQVRDYQSAIDLEGRALALDPDHAMAHHQLGVCLKITGQIEAAQAHFRQAFQLQSDWISPLIELAHCLLSQTQIEATRCCLNQALQISPTDPDLHALQADVHQRIGDLDTALTHLSQAVQQDADFFQALCRYRPNHSQIFELLLNPKRSFAQDQTLKQLLKRPSPAHPVSSPPTSNPSRSIPSSGPDRLPTGGYEKAQDWIRQHPRQGQFIPIHPEHLIQLKSPRSPDPEILKQLRGIQISSPETFITILNQGRAHMRGYLNNPYANYGSAILTPDHHLLADLSSRLPTPRFLDRPYLFDLLHQHPILSLPALPEPHILSGSALVLPLGAMNYFHWMVDVLPCLALIQASDPIDLDQIDHILIHGYKGTAFQDLTLARLKIPKTKILNTAEPKNQHIQAEQLIVPSLAGHISHLTHWGSQVLRDLFLDQPPVPQFRRIYISRQGAKWRRIVNEEALIDLLIPLGFECVRLERFTLPEQAALMRSAAVVLSIHGAGLTNIVFCEPGTQVIEILPRSTILPYFWVIAQQRDLDYFALLGEVCRSQTLCQLLKHPALDREDTVVDINKLREVLEQAKIL